ncbi:MAG: hypothetical protein GSR84_03055 [Desulfurococcales archaeon]|nr:hypothetical protein [Desulfurococcales archaeon]
MVLGLFRRRGNPPAAGAKPIGPRGRMTPEGYIPTPEELEAAEPIPPMGEWWDPKSVGMSEEEAGWVLLARDEWRPRRKEGLKGRALAEPVYRPGFKMPFHALAFDTKSGRIYLLDGTSHAMIYEATGDKTAREIVEMLIEEAIPALHDDDPLKIAFLKEEPGEEDKKEIESFIAALYFQMALLRSKGLLI